MNEWIEWKWTEEKPYPETLETVVVVQCRDGYESHRVPWTVAEWGGGQGESNWEDTGHRSEIVAYRVVK